MKTKRRKVPNKAHFPPEIWIKVFEFLQTTKSFYSLYSLNKDLHNYPWKPTLRQVKFRMKRENESLEHFDFSYVSSLDLYECSRITDNELEHLKGIHTLDLSHCKQITDKGLGYLKGIHTLMGPF